MMDVVKLNLYITVAYLIKINISRTMSIYFTHFTLIKYNIKCDKHTTEPFFDNKQGIL